MEWETHIGRRIREWREREDMTLERLGELTHLDPSFLWRVEAGKEDISARNLCKLAKALNTDVRNLFLQTDLDVAFLQKRAMEKVRQAQAMLEDLRVQARAKGLLKGLLGEALEGMGEVLKAIWVAIPISEELDRELRGLTRPAQRVIRFLLEEGDEEGRYQGPKREIARAIQRSIQTVTNGIKELEAKGLISVERGGGRNRPNRYKVSARLLRLWRGGKGETADEI